MNVVRVKPGVRFDVIAPGGFHILAALDRVAMDSGVDLEITSGTDAHALPDPHATGEAFDVSVHGLSETQLVDVYSRLRAALGLFFTVLYETPTRLVHPTLATLAYVNPKATAPHFHIQVRNGVTYPQVPRDLSTTRSA